MTPEQFNGLHRYGWTVHGNTLTRGHWHLTNCNGLFTIERWYDQMKQNKFFEEKELSEVEFFLIIPWYIGPFKHGWFSLKACRWVMQME